MNNCTFGQTNTTNILSISRNGRSLTPIKNQLHSMTIHCVLETIQFAQRRTINSTFVQPFIQNGQSLTWTDKYWCFSNNRKKKYSSVLFMLVTCILKYWPKIQEYVHYLNFVSFCTIFCWSRNKINIWHVQYTVRNSVAVWTSRRIRDKYNRRKSCHQETESYLNSDKELFKPSKMLMKIIWWLPLLSK